MNNINANAAITKSSPTPSTTRVTWGVTPARASVVVKCSGLTSVMDTPAFGKNVSLL